FLLIVSQTLPGVSGGKILVWPADFSHWINIKVIIDELIARGHNVTVVTHSATPSVKTAQSPGYNVEIIKVPVIKQEFIDHVELMYRYLMNEMPNDNMIQVFLKTKEVIDTFTKMNQVMCRELFAREDLLEKWKEFDVVLTDPIYTCRALLPVKLNLPFVISLRFSFGNTLERLCGQLPTPASYVPGVSLGFPAKMDFPQRVKNLLFIIFQDLLLKYLTSVEWDNFHTQVMG
ncbi:UDP glucuronosyltransferase 2 family, polypeptide A1 precursor, partial [Silurus asotus]